MYGRLQMLQDFKTPLVIKVGARGSPLSKMQVEEVCVALAKNYKGVELDVSYVKTTGDVDQKTSLVDLEKSDFFTKEIDEMLLSKECRIAVHSAKDLPEPLPKGTVIAALTKGLDPSDVLVLRSGIELNSLPEDARIGVSSLRRKEAILNLIPKAHCIDIRGNIEKRLEQLDDEKYDGIILALAALIRLGLTHRNYIKVEGKLAPLQGKLAITCREEDAEMLSLFAPIDSRRLELLNA